MFINPNDTEELELLKSGELFWIQVTIVCSMFILIMLLTTMFAVRKWPHAGGVALGAITTYLMLNAIRLKYRIGRMLIRHWFGPKPTTEEETSSVE